MMLATIVLTTAMAAGPCPGTSLELSVTNAAHTETTAISAAVWTSLTCDPDGGAHPDAKSACDLLRGVDGDLAAHPAEERACTREYDPYTVKLIGTWQGRKIAYWRTFGNRCEMLRHTGPVFSF